MWETPLARLALLELLVSGRLHRRQAQAEAWEALAELPWTQRTGRREEISVQESRRHELATLLQRVWPDWGEALSALTARGLKPTPEGWRALEDALRSENLPFFPGEINRRTAAALVAPHSKAALTERRRAALGAATATHDGSVRVRPPRGLIAQGPQGLVDLSAAAAVLGEVSIPERALRAGLILQGSIRAALTVENLGAFCDLPVPEGWLLLHAPGWDLATVSRLLSQLTHVPLIHFGDLDPNGVRITQHLRKVRPDLKWFVPAFWGELIDTKGRPCQWPQELDLSDMPALVRQLAGLSLWLEQEILVLDSRVIGALEELLVESC